MMQGGASMLSLGAAAASEAPDGVCGSKLGAGSEVELFADTLALLQVGCGSAEAGNAPPLLPCMLCPVQLAMLPACLPARLAAHWPVIPAGRWQLY